MHRRIPRKLWKHHHRPHRQKRRGSCRHGTALPLYLVSAAPLDFFSTTSPAAVRRARKRVRAHVSYRATSGPPMDSRASKSAAAGSMLAWRCWPTPSTGPRDPVTRGEGTQDTNGKANCERSPTLTSCLVHFEIQKVFKILSH